VEACDSLERVPGAIVMDCVSARTVVGDDVFRSGDGGEGDLWLAHRVLSCCGNGDGAGEVAKEQSGEGTTCNKPVNDDQSGGNGSAN
jgi:hypothetical protein